MPLSLKDMRATRRPASTGRLSLGGLRAQRQEQVVEEEPEPDYGWGDTLIAGGLRVVPSIAGTVGGGALGALAGGVGAPVGAMAGGAAFGGIGEWLAQQYEKARGLRDETSYGAIGVEAGLGAIPLGKSATLARAAAKGAGMNVFGGGAHRYVEEGRISSPGEAALDATIGGTFGAGAEAIGRRFFPGPRPPAAPGEAPRSTFNELDPKGIAARSAAVERAPGDEFIDALDDEVYRYPDGQPRRAARDPRAYAGTDEFPDVDGTIPRFGDEGYDPQRVVSPLQHEADRVDMAARDPNRIVPRSGRKRLSIEGLRTYRLAGQEFTPEDVIARQAGVEPPPAPPPELAFTGVRGDDEVYGPGLHFRRGGERFDPQGFEAVPSPLGGRIQPEPFPEPDIDAIGRGDLPFPSSVDPDAPAVMSELRAERARELWRRLTRGAAGDDVPPQDIPPDASPAPTSGTPPRDLPPIPSTSTATLDDVQSELAPAAPPKGRNLLRDMLDQVHDQDRSKLSRAAEQWMTRRDRQVAGDWPEFDPPAPDRVAREAANEAALQRYSKRFGTKSTEAIRAFATRYPRLFNLFNFDTLPKEVRDRRRGDFMPLDMTKDTDTSKLGTIRLRARPVNATTDDVFETLAHEARHGLDRRFTSGRDYAQRLVDEFNVPWGDRSMEKAAIDTMRRARQLMERSRTLGRPLTAQERVELARPVKTRQEIAKLEDTIASIDDEARVAQSIDDPILGEGAARKQIPLMQRLAQLRSGQTGEVSAELAQTLGGGAVGAVAGATYGDTTDEHIGGALAGGAAGLAGGKALARFLRRAKPTVDLPYHERPLPKSGKPIAPIRNAPTPTGRYIVEHNSAVFEFEPSSNKLPRRQPMPASQAADLGLDNFPEESRDALAEVIAEFDPKEIAQQRGGRQPMAHTHALARRMKLDAEKALAPGKNLSRAGHDAYANAFHSTAMDARELGRKQRAEGLDDRETARFLMLQQANRALGLSYFGLRSEAGGSLNVYKHLKKLMPGEVRLLTEMIDRGRLRKDMADLGNLYADLPDDPVKAFERLREIEASQRSTMDKLTSYYTSNILSGVKTQLRNVLGNASRLVARLPAKASAGALDAFLAKAQGRERQVYASEIQHELKGLYAGLGNAWRDGIETFKLGFSPEGLREGLEDLRSLHVPRAEFKGGLKNPINLPGRGMAAADRFFRQLNASMELHAETYAHARRAAERNGLTGAAFDSAVSSSMIEQRMNPSRELRQRVSKAAERAVYQNEPGPAVRALGAFIRHVPAGRFVAPFLGTVHQILKQGAIDFGPLGFLRTASRTGELRDQMNARGEALAGTLALGPIAMLAATGAISGAGPTDPQKRDELYESGWRPHSIRVPGGHITNAVAEALGASRSDDGDWWVNYTLVQPIAVQAAIVANGFEAWSEHQERQANKSNPDGGEAVITSTIMRAAQSAFSQSFLSGVGDLIDAINDPNRGQQFFGRIAQGFLPLSGLQRNIAQAVDPVVRQPEGIKEHLAANIPFASTTVDPRLDRWGEDVRRTGFGAMMVPEAQPANRDPIADELTRLDVRVGRPTDRLRAPAELGGGPIKMDDATAMDVRRFRGRSTRAMLSIVMGAPGYEHIPDEIRAEMLREAVSEASTNAGDAARMSLLLQRPELLRLLAEPVEEAAAASYPAR